MKKVLLCAMLAALALMLGVGGLSAAKDYRAERFDATWQVEADGSLLITETVVFNFEGGPFTFVYRELPDDYSDGIEIVDVRLDGETLEQGEGAGFYEVEDDDPLTVTWRFEPTSDASRTFDLTYRARGVVRRENGEDLLWWNFLPTDYEYPIDAATLRVAYPDSAQRIGPAEVRRGEATITESDGEVRFDTTNVPAGAPLTVALRFEEGSVISEPPAWQQQQAQIRQTAPLVVGLTALVAAAGGALLAFMWRRGRRATSAAQASSPLVYAPPSDLAPGLAGGLVNGDAKPSATQAIATIFSLAQRGLIDIRQTGEKKWYSEPPYEFRKTPGLAAASLLPHESQLVDLLFADKGGPKDEVTLSEVGKRLQSKLSPFSKAATQELTEQGYVDPARRKYASRFVAAAGAFLALAAVAVVAAIVLVDNLGGWIFLLPVALFTLGMIAFALAASYSPLSDRGEEQAAAWRGFREHIKAIAKGREASWDTQLFDRYFPYAAAFGLTEGWAKAFQKAGGTEAPAWFRGLSAADDGSSIIPFIVMTSAINSTGSSAATGGAGGGGAGGGGGSGAG